LLKLWSMDNFDRRRHWETIYRTKKLNEVSWYQPVPTTSLALIEEACIARDAKIIDVGGGDSFLADYLLEKGYMDISVLDISEAALERAKARLGENAASVKWIVSDVTAFSPEEKYDIWHDRAAFHFLTSEPEIRQYVNVVERSIKTGGTLIIGTFSEQGPKKCSGIDIKQYTAESLVNTFKEQFTIRQSILVDHSTPFETVQNFLFCTFLKS
jgi:2-polyprenyl-3-methyl-5-hydroxy-6-metoxy-1,4-benzoquinol methylase